MKCETIKKLQVQTRVENWIESGILMLMSIVFTTFIRGGEKIIDL